MGRSVLLFSYDFVDLFEFFVEDLGQGNTSESNIDCKHEPETFTPSPMFLSLADNQGSKGRTKSSGSIDDADDSAESLRIIG